MRFLDTSAPKTAPPRAAARLNRIPATRCLFGSAPFVEEEPPQPGRRFQVVRGLNNPDYSERPPAPALPRGGSAIVKASLLRCMSEFSPRSGEAELA